MKRVKRQQGGLLPAHPRADVAAIALAETVRKARELRRQRRVVFWASLADMVVILVALLNRTERRVLYADCVAAAIVQIGKVLAWKHTLEDGLAEPDEVVEHEETERPAQELTERQWAVQQSLDRAATTLRRSYRQSGWVFFSSLGGAAGLSWLMWRMFEFPWFVVNGILWTGLGMWLLGKLEQRGNRAANDVVAQIRHADPAVAGAIIDFIGSSDARFHEHALTGLESLLNRMRPEHATLLSSDQRRFLYGRLKPALARARPSTALAVMGMIEQIRDRSAEPYLQALLAMPNPTSDQDKSLLSAAYFALQSLEQENEALARRGTLLSPADSPYPPEESLLRPRLSQFDDPANQLLRSAPGSDREET